MGSLMGKQESLATESLPMFTFRPFVWTEHKIASSKLKIQRTYNGRYKEPLPRSGHTLVYHKGCLYTFGGFNSDLPEEKQLLSELWEYNILNNEWRMLKIEGDIPMYHLSHSACVVDENEDGTGPYAKLLVYDGTGVPFARHMSGAMFSCNLNPPYLWRKLMPGTLNGQNDINFSDVASNENEGRENDLPRPVYGNATIIVKNPDSGSEFYTVGGSNGLNYLIDVDKFSLRQKRWEVCYRSGRGSNRLIETNEPQGRYKHGLAVKDNQIVLLGGSTPDEVNEFKELWVFDTSINLIGIKKPSLNIGQIQHRERNMHNIAGWHTVMTFPETTVQIEEKFGYPAPRRCHGCIQTGNFVYIFGGCDGSVVFQDTWRLNLDTWTWMQMPCTLPEPTFFQAATISPSGQLFTFGGVTLADSSQRTKKIHSTWFGIPSLREITLQALQYYLPGTSNFCRDIFKETGIKFSKNLTNSSRYF